MIKAIKCPDLLSALEKLSELVREENCIVFCGDRFTLLAEQAICEKTKGTFFTSVLTFVRFLRGYVSERMLSKQGSVMAIRRLLSECEGKLSCFQGHVASDAASDIYETIIRLSSSKVTPAILEQADCGENVVLRNKLDDIAFIQASYELFLANKNYLDESNYFRMLPKVIQERSALEGKHVMLFGFPFFAAQMREGIEACFLNASSVTAFFFGGEEVVDDFIRMAAPFGGAVCETLRTEESGAVKQIREGLFRPESLAKSVKPELTDAVVLYEAKDKREEISFIAAAIRKHLAEGKRYRDFALLVPDLEEYALTVKGVFGEFHIPCFFDSKKSMAEHPLGRFLLSVFEAEIDGGLPQTIQALTANRYFSDPVERAAADPKFLCVDGYRNYLRRYAWYRGGAKREIKEIEGLRIEDLKLWREKLLSYAVPHRADGKEYVDRIREILVSCEAGEVTKRLVEECKDPSFASYLKQGQEKVEKLLEEAETLLTGYYLDAREMREILRSGLAAAEVSLIPMKNDAVFVGGLAESKFLPVKVLFAAGLKDGVPKVQEDTALLADKDLEQIRSVKIRIEPTVAQSNQRVRESVLLNLCSFTEKLYATLPIDGSEGRSEIFAYLTHLFTYTGASGLRFFREGDVSPLLPALADRCATKELALQEMLLQKNDYESGRRDTTQIGSLYRAVTQTQEEKRRADGLYAGREKKKFLFDGEKLYLSETVSPTMLEEYFDCPYRCFLEKGLRLTRESVGATQSTDSGNFVHTVLERLAREMKEKRVSSEQECALTAERIARELTDETPYRFERDTASGRYRLSAIVKESVEVSIAMFRTIERSDFEVDEVEYWIRRPLGERMLSGKVDRVDRAGDALRVVDYKTGSIDTKPDSYYSGRKLQLELYLGALSPNGSAKKPSGAFYFSASREFRKEEERNYFMTGFFNEETLPAQDRTAEAGQSELFDNSQGKRSGKVLTDELFASFIDYAMLVSEKGVEEMAQGFIGACPYGGCPDWCAHKGVCGAEEGAGREKYSLTCTDIAEIARQEKKKREEQS